MSENFRHAQENRRAGDNDFGALGSDARHLRRALMSLAESVAYRWRICAVEARAVGLVALHARIRLMAHTIAATVAEVASARAARSRNSG